MKWYEKKTYFLQVIIVLNEEKRILRFCPFIKERFWILYQMRRQDFSGGGEERWGTKNYKKGIIVSLVNEFN